MVKKLIMLVFLALAVGMAVPSTREQIVERAFVPVKDEIGRRLVPRRIEVMADQLDVRLSRGEGLPQNFEGWLRRDYSGSELDPWGRMYFIQVGRRNYTVGSMGPDGLQATDDDMTISRPLTNGR